MPVSSKDIETVLIEKLEAVHVDVHDDSDGCGAKFTVLIVSDKFEGKPLLQRHRMVNEALASEMKCIHAFSMKTLTKKQWEEMPRDDVR